MNDNEPIPGEIPSDVKKEPGKTSRRNFLKLGATALAASAITYATGKLGIKPGEPEPTPSPEVILKPKTLVLDFFELDKFEEKYLQNTFPQEASQEKNWQTMGVDNPTATQGLLKAVPQNEDQAKLLLMELFKQRYQKHGENVSSVMSKTASYLNLSQESINLDRISIADAVSLGGLTYDNLGNPTIDATLSPEEVDSLVSNSSQSVVNMSFELGDFSLTYSLYDKKFKYPEMGRQGPSSIGGDPIIYHDYQGNTITKE